MSHRGSDGAQRSHRHTPSHAPPRRESRLFVPAAPPHHTHTPRSSTPDSPPPAPEKLATARRGPTHLRRERKLMAMDAKSRVTRARRKTQATLKASSRLCNAARGALDAADVSSACGSRRTHVA